MFFDTQNEKADEGPKKTGFEPLPAGWYRVLIDGAITKDLQSRAGRAVSVTYSVLDEPYKSKNRKLFDWFNTHHTSEKAKNIGKAEFAQLLQAANFTDNLQSEQDLGKLQNKTLYVEVVVEPHYKSGEPTNVVKRRAAQPKTEKTAPAKPAGPLDKIPF